MLGVDIVAADQTEAIALMDRALSAEDGATQSVFYVNAHTLKLASEEPDLRTVLQGADYVFGDGTGVRWAVRFKYGVRFHNVNGTDLIPALLSNPAEPPRSYFLLGATPEAIPKAAVEVRSRFPAWRLVGHHHGYVPLDDCDDVIDEINRSGADLLLVGMGNPKQEIWIHRNRQRLRVKLCMGVGGLFDYWAGDLDRAPEWMRRAGLEWLHLMLRQPRKVGRYLIGGPLFLLRVALQGRNVAS